MAEQGEQQMSEQQQFSLQRLYVKDLSFESPGAPQAFQLEWRPEMKMELSSKSMQIEPNLFEVVLNLTVKVKNKGATAFIMELEQAGLFNATGFEGKDLARLLGSVAPNILFPYAREAVSDLVGKGSFPQLLLAPVNFEGLFQEAMKRRESESQTAALTEDAPKITH